MSEKMNVKKIAALAVSCSQFVSYFFLPIIWWDVTLSTLFAAGILGFAWERPVGWRWLWKILFFFTLFVTVALVLTLALSGLGETLQDAEEPLGWFLFDGATLIAATVYLFLYAYRSRGLWPEKSMNAPEKADIVPKNMVFWKAYIVVYGIVVVGAVAFVVSWSGIHEAMILAFVLKLLFEGLIFWSMVGFIWRKIFLRQWLWKGVFVAEFLLFIVDTLVHINDTISQADSCGGRWCFVGLIAAPIVVLPILYALYAYAYRSRALWTAEKTEAE